MIESKYFKDLNLFRESWIHMTMILTDIDNRLFLEEKFDSFFLNSNVEVYNSYDGSTTTSLASNILQDIADKYIIVENGCLFLKHEIFTAPCVNSYKTLKKLRSYYKKAMKQAKAEGNAIVESFQNLMQQNTKEALNTFYGIMINIASKYYNFDVAGSTTIRGRSTVSMNGLTIESIFGKYRPYQLSNHLHFIHEATNKKVDWDFWNDKILEVPTHDMIIDHLLMEHNDGTYYGYDILMKRIARLSDTEKKIVYYTGNFEAMVKLPWIQKLILEIMSRQNKDAKYVEEVLSSGDKEALSKLKNTLYLDPMVGPEHLKEDFSLINRYIKEILYGFFWYEGDMNEFGERLDSTEEIFKNIHRDRIIVTDTDSLIIYLDDDMTKIKNIEGFKEATKDFNHEMLEYVVGSFVINALSTVVSVGLERYTRMSNIPEEYRPVISYKQEFFFLTLQVTKGAKNYIGYIGIQEGILLPHKETELKGLSLKKANFNPTLSKRAKEIALEMIAEKKNPDLREILKKIEENRIELVDMYKNKENIQMFTISKYKKGYDDLFDYERGNDRIKACLLYNALYPDRDPIKIPGSFLVATIDFANREEDLQERFPEQYKKIDQYNRDRLLLKYQMSVRSKIRALYNIEKDEDIDELKVTDPAVLDFMYKVDKISTYEELNELIPEIKAEYKEKIKKELPYNENIWSILDKTSIEKNKIAEIKKIAIPLDSEVVDEFITEYMSTDDILVFENLASVIVEGLGLMTIRNNSDRSTLSNIVTYF